MSADPVSWVLRKSETKGTDRLVLLVLADAADPDGTNAWPSVATIAERANITRRGAQQSLRRLETEGHIRIEERLGGPVDGRADRRPNRYTVHMTRRTAVHPAPDHGAKVTTSRGENHDVTGRTAVRPTLSLPTQDQERSATTPAPEQEPGADDSRETSRRSRPLDPIWEALVKIFGEPVTATERARLGKARKELAVAGATGEEVLARAREAWRRWEGKPFGPEALCKHWTSLATPAPTRNGSGSGRGRTALDAFRDLDAMKEEIARDVGRVGTDRETPSGELPGL